MTTENNLRVKELNCQGRCPFNAHQNLFTTLIDTNNDCEYISEWATQHLQGDCNGPLFANLVDGGTIIYTVINPPRVVNLIPLG